ncbi:MAG: hypothetical protein Q3982_04315 [Phoenicibacter congonensis]|uniref:Uncharacterized protein n=1 Tax=Phoenicibacter congonensis TaxID=1944646 RepID=A0AA43RHF2_9ACTN|nr:hypothetical protein [Phoenicibacter congonensis]
MSSVPQVGVPQSAPNPNKTEVIGTSGAPSFVQGQSGVSSTVEVIGDKGKYVVRQEDRKQSRAPLVALVFATVVIVIGGVFAAFYIVKPPIAALKDTPFSSVTTDTQTSAQVIPEARDSAVI